MEVVVAVEVVPKELPPKKVGLPAVTKAVAAKLAPAATKPVPAKPVLAKPAATPAKSAESIPAILAAKKVEAPKLVAPSPVKQSPAVVVAAPIFSAPAVAASAPSNLLPDPLTIAVEAATPEGNIRMNDTVKNAQDTVKNLTADATARAADMFGDVSTRAKSAMEKGSKTMEEVVEFSKGNLEAVVASGRVAAKGVQDIAKYSAEFGRKSIEDANANAKKFAAVKSPTEFFALQSEIAKAQLDAFVGEASKFTESYMNLIGEIAQPVQNRYAVAVEKVKTITTA